MRSLSNIEDFESYTSYSSINESLTDGAQTICNRAFINGGPITFRDGTSVQPKEIVDVIEKALSFLRSNYSRTFEFGDNLNIILLAHSKRYDTMAVDENLNLYMNAGFIYHTLKMDKHLVAAVIMHEVLHVLYDHIERGKNWLAAKGKPINNSTWNDNNLTADVEVNQTLVKLGIVTEEELINDMNGIFLFNSGKRRGSSTNILPMETLLEDPEYMAKLRSMHPAEPDPETTPEKKITTTDDWDKGYKDAWNKMAGLIKKYGYKKVWDMLVDAGIINSVGELNDEKEISDIKGLEFLNVKSMDEFLNESLTPSDEGQTYDDGFTKGFSKILNRLQSAIKSEKEGPDSPEGPDGPKSPKFKSKIDEDDLEEIDIPQKKQKGKGGDGDDLPENIKDQPNNDNDDDNDDSKKGKSKSKSGGKGGEGKSDDEITDDDLNKLEDDLKKKGGKTRDDSEEKDPGAIGGTGSFIYSGNGKKDDIEDVLKEAGYSKEDIEKVKKIRDRNKVKNNKEAIEKAKNEMRRKLKGTTIGRILNDIDVESSKYKNVWKEVMEEFMSKNTRLAGRDTPTGSNDWKRKKSIARGEYGVHHKFERKDPQDVNVYVDVSGSMDLELLEVIGKSLVLFSQQYEYSGINICPWASSSNGVYPVDDFFERDENEITKEILQIISKGAEQCGGGTEASAVMSAMSDCIVYNLQDEDKESKDDVHVVITDGFFDFNNLENRIKSVLKSEIGMDDVADTAVNNTFWMIYDANESHQDEWKKEIKNGKLIFINSETVKNNK